MFNFGVFFLYTEARHFFRREERLRKTVEDLVFLKTVGNGALMVVKTDRADLGKRRLPHIRAPRSRDRRPLRYQPHQSIT